VLSMELRPHGEASCSIAEIPSPTPFSLARWDVLGVALVHEGPLACRQAEYLFDAGHDVNFQDPTMSSRPGSP